MLSLPLFPIDELVLTYHSQLAAPPVHPNERVTDLHIPLLRLHILPQQALRLLLVPALDPLRLLMQLGGPMLLRLLLELV